MPEQTVDSLLLAAKCALADLEGIMPEFEPSGDRNHPAWKTIEELRDAIKSQEAGFTFNVQTYNFEKAEHGDPNMPLKVSAGKYLVITFPPNKNGAEPDILIERQDSGRWHVYVNPDEGDARAQIVLYDDGACDVNDLDTEQRTKRLT